MPHTKDSQAEYDHVAVAGYLAEQIADRDDVLADDIREHAIHLVKRGFNPQREIWNRILFDQSNRDHQKMINRLYTKLNELYGHYHF